MIVKYDCISALDIRKKAIGIPIKHDGVTKVFWCPKSVIINQYTWEKDGFFDVEDWFYDKKFIEVFIQGDLFRK